MKWQSDVARWELLKWVAQFLNELTVQLPIRRFSLNRQFLAIERDRSIQGDIFIPKACYRHLPRWSDYWISREGELLNWVAQFLTLMIRLPIRSFRSDSLLTIERDHLYETHSYWRRPTDTYQDEMTNRMSLDGELPGSEMLNFSEWSWS
jgi:hypothetical protein